VKKKYIFLVFIYLITSITAFAQEKSGYRYVKAWKLSERLAIPDSIAPDTIHLNFQDANPLDRFSIANSYNANYCSPVQSKIYFDRPDNTDFLFSNAYYPYINGLWNTTFYNTKNPLSNLTYNSGGSTFRKEENIKFLYSANLKKNLGIGTTLDYIYSVGEYGNDNNPNQAAKKFSGSVFSYLNGKHYSYIGVATINNLKNFENGGIKDPLQITHPTSNVEAKDLVTNTTGFSAYRYNQFYFNHKYSIGFDRKIKVTKDSIRTEYVPVTYFTHTLRLNQISKRFYEKTADSAFYDNTYYSYKQTKDTAALQTISNTFAISMAEEFNKWAKFGMTAYIHNDMERYTYLTDTIMNHTWKSNTFLGGILSKQQGQRFRYIIQGEFGLIGSKSGTFSLDGDVRGNFKLWKDSVSLTAKGFVRSEEPSFFLQDYESNHFKWHNNFGRIFRTNVSGVFAIPTRKFSLKVSVENVKNYIYFDKAGLPQNNLDNIQIVSAYLRQDFSFKAFTLENTVAYQVSSNQNIIPLPDISLYNNLYYHGTWFKVLNAQLGANFRYNTAYYSPSYMPATGQFYNQNTTKVGNFPVVSVYANFHLKQARFFIEYYHINQLFSNDAYFSMPLYPINPAIMKLGISWNFYN